MLTLQKVQEQRPKSWFMMGGCVKKCERASGYERPQVQAVNPVKEVQWHTMGSLSSNESSKTSGPRMRPARDLM